MRLKSPVQITLDAVVRAYKKHKVAVTQDDIMSVRDTPTSYSSLGRHITTLVRAGLVVRHNNGTMPNTYEVAQCK